MRFLFLFIYLIIFKISDKLFIIKSGSVTYDFIVSLLLFPVNIKQLLNPLSSANLISEYIVSPINK